MAHRNARLTLHGRLLLCRRIEDQGWTVRAAAEAAGVSRQTASKWRRRLALEGISGLADRTKQLKAFLGATKDDRLSPLFHVLAMTGMRRGEACGLRWDDVDLEAAGSRSGAPSSPTATASS